MRRLGALTALTVASLLGLAATSSAEHNADHGCVKSGPPKVHESTITRTSVVVSIWYNDTCVLPAKSYVEFSEAQNENWELRGKAHTDPTSETYWRERRIEINGLRPGDHYKVRSGVTLLYSDRESSAVYFRTDR